MNNPFCYEPHPLCIMACKELQEKIAQRDDWREEIDRGKMFGVLIVEKPRKDGEATEPQTGYIAAYSGQIGGRSDWPGFVIKRIVELCGQRDCASVEGQRMQQRRVVGAMVLCALSAHYTKNIMSICAMTTRMNMPSG